MREPSARPSKVSVVVISLVDARREIGYQGVARTVKGDGDEEDDKTGAGRHGEGHANEYRVEEDAGFEEEALEKKFALFLD